MRRIKLIAGGYKNNIDNGRCFILWNTYVNWSVHNYLRDPQHLIDVGRVRHDVWAASFKYETVPPRSSDA